MTQWGAEGRDHHDPYGEASSAEGSGWTLRQLATRAGALVLLFSILGSAIRMLRGIEYIEFVAALVGLAALIGAIAKRQRASEEPYRSEDSPEIP